MSDITRSSTIFGTDCSICGHVVSLDQIVREDLDMGARICRRCEGRCLGCKGLKAPIDKNFWYCADCRQVD